MLLSVPEELIERPHHKLTEVSVVHLQVWV